MGVSDEEGAGGAGEVPEDFFVPDEFGSVPDEADYWALKWFEEEAPSFFEEDPNNTPIPVSQAYELMQAMIALDEGRPPPPPSVDDEDIWWEKPERAPGPGDVSGPVGPVGHTGGDGPAYGVLPGPDDVGSAIFFGPWGLGVGAGVWGEYRAYLHWRERVDTRAYDLCDDADALALAWGGRFVEPGEVLSEADRDKLVKTRRRFGAKCDGDPWDTRYVAVAPDGGGYGRSPASRTPEEALFYVIDRHDQPDPGRSEKFPGNLTRNSEDRRPGGFHASGVELPREFPLEAGDAVVMSEKGFVVEGGVLRGLLHNQSRTLFARNVSVTVTGTDPDGNPVTGTWQWPITMQPGEFAPIEINGWAGSADYKDTDFDVAYNLSAYADYTRSFEMAPSGRQLWRPGYSTYEISADPDSKNPWVMAATRSEAATIELIEELFPEDLVDGELPQGYERYSYVMGWQFEPPDSHPGLHSLIQEFRSALPEQTTELLFSPDQATAPGKGVGPHKLHNVGQFNLRAYIAFVQGEPAPPSIPAGSIYDVVDLTPYLYPTRAYSTNSFYIPLPSYSSGFIIWLGGANLQPNRPSAATDTVGAQAGAG